MSYQLRIAGANPTFRQTKDNLAMLTPQAIDLAKRGYTAILIETSAPSRGLQIRTKDEAIDISLFNNTDIAEVPHWIATAKADLEHQIQRTNQ